MAHHRIHRLIIATLTTLAAHACGGTDSADGAAQTADSAGDMGAAGDSVADTWQADTNAAEEDAITADAGLDAGGPSVPVGAGCAGDDDCPGGTCLDWLPGGYCSITCNPADPPCPGHTVCAPIHSHPTLPLLNVCLALCDTAADCRSGYACDDDTTCWPINNPIGTQKAIGAPCRVANECKSNLCQPELSKDRPTGFVDGSCILTGCQAKTCGGDGTCVMLSGGNSACFASCKSQADCRGGYGCNLQAGACLPGCSDHPDCPDKHVCANGLCVNAFVACSVSNPVGQCAGQQWCDDGTCTASAFDCDAADPYEPNDDAEHAVPLTSRRTFGGRVCATDSDWFSVEVPAGEHVEVQLVFSNHAGDLDLLVHDPAGEFVRSRWIAWPYKGKLWADFDKSGEAVAFYHPTLSQTWLLRVVGSEGASNNYGLTVRRTNFADGAACSPTFKSEDCLGKPEGVLRLLHWPQPQADDPYGAGYRFATVSGYKWGRRELIMLVRDGLRALREQYPDTAVVSLADTCQQDGVTPGYDIGKPRHCFTCHDQGGNIDIAYFTTDGSNKVQTICGPDGANVDKSKQQCAAAAKAGHIVDLDRQTWFIARLFDSGRVRAIGIDPVVGPLVQARAKEMRKAGQISAAGNAGIQTKFGLWATHHDHIHVSLEWW